MSSILIVENQKLTAVALAKRVKALKHTIIGIVETGEAAIDFVRQKQVPDIIIMDIDLATKMTGIEAAQRIREDYLVGIIYLTKFTNMSDDEIALPLPYDFVEKPITNAKLNRALANMQKRLSERVSQPSLNLQKIALPDLKGIRFETYLHDILYVKADGQYCKVITTNGNAHLTIPLKTFMDKYPHADFMRVHKSYMVNTSKIEGVKSHQIFLPHFSDETYLSPKEKPPITIGREWRNDFYERFPHYRKGR
ncbi:MAG: response regulator transcription factor [Chitinophagales bacterium]